MKVLVLEMFNQIYLHLAFNLVQMIFLNPENQGFKYRIKFWERIIKCLAHLK